MEVISEQHCFGGVEGVYSHVSVETGTPMRFSVFRPASNDAKLLPVLWYLSGLTCTEENFTVKGGAQRYAAEHGLMLVAPDTSPRGANIDGEDDSYDFGSGAGFYVDATVSPWSKNYRMYSYVTVELPKLIFSSFAADPDRQGITGHSMGGHGALTIGLKNPDTYRSISAFSPICAPMQCPWGEKALTGYIGANRESWGQYDAVSLISQGARSGRILVDQGDADDFLTEQLKPELLDEACKKSGQELTLRMQPGYDHSYYFVSTFIGDHVAFHAERLVAE
jgi:S-formylglutathione hydrolase